MVQLSKRLQAVADLLTNGSTMFCVADVGTDHGYIPIYLMEQEKCKKAIAMDIGKGPLQRAKEHIEEYRLGAYIETRLSNGLAELKTGEADGIVIAGMGGATMQGILEAGESVLTPDTILVLQPQSELDEFRTYLMQHGYELLAEDMVQEDGKFYPMMKVRRGSSMVENENEQNRNPKDFSVGQWNTGMSTDGRLELLYGPLLLKEKHPILKEYLLWQQGQKQKILLQLKENATPEIRNQRTIQVQDELESIQQALRIMQMHNGTE